MNHINSTHDGESRVGCSNIQREAWLITRLAITLMGYLGTSTRWMIMCGRLIAFVIILLPAFIRIVYWWINQVINGRILRSVPYSCNARNYLDIYLPNIAAAAAAPSSSSSPSGSSNTNKVPVVVFVSGGAWTIGYKGWGGLMGRVMAQHGVLFVAPDYRNFPQGNMSHMLDDIDNAMSWIFANIGAYGGDVNNIWLCGQSAGAHLTCMTILNQVRRAYEMATHTHMPIPIPIPMPHHYDHHHHHTTHDEHMQSQCTDDNDLDDDNVAKEYPPRTSHIPSASASGSIIDTHISTPSLPLPLPVPSPTITDGGPHHHDNDNGNINVIPLSDGYGWRANDLRGYIGVSGPFDLVPLLQHLEGRGINRRLFTSIVGGDERSLPLYSPYRILNDMRIATATATSTSSLGMNLPASSDTRPFYALPEVTRLFPRMALYHGSDDLSVPISSSRLLCDALTRCGIQCSLTCYTGKSHTDPILEDPMSGCDPLLDDILTMIQSRSIRVSSPQLINRWSIALARRVNPF